ILLVAVWPPRALFVVWIPFYFVCGNFIFRSTKPTMRQTTPPVSNKSNLFSIKRLTIYRNRQVAPHVKEASERIFKIDFTNLYFFKKNNITANKIVAIIM